MQEKFAKDKDDLSNSQSDMVVQKQQELNKLTTTHDQISQELNTIKLEMASLKTENKQLFETNQ